MAANFLVFFSEVLPREYRTLIPISSKCCLQPFRILQNSEWRRLLFSAFIHADEMHIYYNMSSLLWKGVQLERRMGSTSFAFLLAELLLVSHAIYVGAAYVLAQSFPEFSALYYSTCAVGFSAVLFGMKVVLNYNDPGFSTFFGITLPTKYLAWAELLLASYFNPRASFFGHLCGILAGWLHVKFSAGAYRGISRGLHHLWRALQAQPRATGQGHRLGTRPPPPNQQRPQFTEAPVYQQQPRRADVPPAQPHGAGHTTGGAAAMPVSEEELRQRRMARFDPPPTLVRRRT